MSISWMWGGNKKVPTVPEGFNDFIPNSNEGGGDKNKGEGDDKGGSGGAMESYRFDSSALERAAKSAKDLENNPHAKEILELSRQTEITKQSESKLQTIAMQGELERIRAEEQRKLMQDKYKQDKSIREYQDQLARKRQTDGLEMERRQKEEIRRKEDEAQENRLMRERAEMEERMKKQAIFDMQRVEQKEKARGKVERENHDLTMEQIRLKAKEERETKLETLKSFSSLFGAGFNSFFSDRNKVELVVGGAVALTAGVMFSRQALGLGFRTLEANMLKPSIVRDTSRITLTDIIKHPIQSAKKVRGKFLGSEDALKGVVLKPEIEAAIRDIAIKTKQCRQVNGCYRNVLLHGPPGTGKTLFAKKLALNSNMDYAFMTGGDIQLMGGKGVDSVHKLFAWARTSRRGLILFIDEAESFLIRRHAGLDHSLKETLAAFLSHTGEQNNKFMMVLTSNIPHELDTALHSRIHEMIEFGLPGLPERTRLIALYFQEYILDPVSTGKWRIKLDECDWSTACRSVAEITEGMSGRELTQLASDWQMQTVTSDSGVLTSELMMERARLALERKKQSREWDEFNKTNTAQYSDILKVLNENLSKREPSVSPVTHSSK